MIRSSVIGLATVGLAAAVIPVSAQIDGSVGGYKRPPANRDLVRHRGTGNGVGRTVRSPRRLSAAPCSGPSNGVMCLSVQRVFTCWRRSRKTRVSSL